MSLDFNTFIYSLPALNLNELDSVSLLNRVDKKFTLPITQLFELEECLKNNYRILEIDSVRAFRYENNYFDTPDLNFYKEHHSGYANRVKVRCRKYVESGLTFFEIKKKEKINRTNKYREQTSDMIFSLGESQKNKLSDFTRKNTQDIALILKNNFTRITFVDSNFSERVTIDTTIVFIDDNQEIKLNNVAVLEIKQSKTSQSSPLLQFLKQKGIREKSFSKYIFGIISLMPNVKKNNFLALIKNINNI
jgi:hypothetical protein